jgi:hypothetical protein
VIQYDANHDHCLWILSAQDQFNPDISADVKPFLDLSNINRIQDSQNAPFDTQLFGNQYPKSWCYYFQKTQLSAQSANWGSVVSLWDQANQLGFSPKNVSEYVPFIKGLAFTGRLDQALDLSVKADVPKDRMNDYICHTWKDIRAGYPMNEDRDGVIDKAIQQLGCQD